MQQATIRSSFMLTCKELQTGFSGLFAYQYVVLPVGKTQVIRIVNHFKL